jgi:hypothetical protein
MNVSTPSVPYRYWRFIGKLKTPDMKQIFKVEENPRNISPETKSLL